MNQVPIPLMSNEQHYYLEKTTNQILGTKAADHTADTLALEADIDQLVYELYGLTDEEIAIVEGRG